MALFSRKNRPHDDDTVPLGSTHHRWWTGDAPTADEAVLEAELVLSEARSSDRSPALARSSGLSPDIVDALAEFGYGEAAGSLLARSAVAGLPAEQGAQDAAGEPAASGELGADTSPLVVDEGSLFVRDGLPAEDRMADLLGVLGLEKDAPWVDIARAHRRLAPITGTVGSDPGPERRAANEAYACLRLFHH